MTAFGKQLEQFAQKTGGKLDTLHRLVVFTIYRGVVFKTPVGNPDLWASPAPKGYVGGFLRASWQIATQPVTQTKKHPGPGGSFPEPNMQIPTYLKGGTVTFIANTAPYALAVEFGHSKQQAPNGMARITVKEVVAQFNGLVKQVNP